MEYTWINIITDVVIIDISVLPAPIVILDANKNTVNVGNFKLYYFYDYNNYNL